MLAEGKFGHFGLGLPPGNIVAARFYNQPILRRSAIEDCVHKLLGRWFYYTGAHAWPPCWAFRGLLKLGFFCALFWIRVMLCWDFQSKHSDPHVNYENFKNEALKIGASKE